MNFWELKEESIDTTLSLRLLMVLLSMAIIIMSFDSLATSGSDPVGDTLCTIIKTFRGNTARGIAVVGIIVIGIQTLRGKLQWEVALITVTGVVILFKASDIVTMIGGSANATCAS